jgi:hypothetical protein
LILSAGELELNDWEKLKELAEDEVVNVKQEERGWLMIRLLNGLRIKLWIEKKNSLSELKNAITEETGLNKTFLMVELIHGFLLGDDESLSSLGL